MSAPLTLYSNPMSRARIAHWMLEEVGAAYEVEWIGYGAGMTAPDFRRLNPMGKVPVLVHGAQVVSECAAICAYLADAFPEAGLAPAPADRAAYYRWLFFAAGPLEAAATNRALGFEVAKDQERMAGYGNFDRTMDALELAVTAQDHVAGPVFSAADVYVGSHVIWGLDFKSIEDRPAFRAYADRLRDRPAKQRADAFCEAHAAEAGLPPGQ